jgi:hypothetical protein
LALLRLEVGSSSMMKSSLVLPLERALDSVLEVVEVADDSVIESYESQC